MLDLLRSDRAISILTCYARKEQAVVLKDKEMPLFDFTSHSFTPFKEKRHQSGRFLGWVISNQRLTPLSPLMPW